MINLIRYLDKFCVNIYRFLNKQSKGHPTITCQTDFLLCTYKKMTAFISININTLNLDIIFDVRFSILFSNGSSFTLHVLLTIDKSDSILN